MVKKPLTVMEETCGSISFRVDAQGVVLRLENVPHPGSFGRSVIFLLYRWVQPTVLSHLTHAVLAMNFGAVCLPLGSLIL